MSSASFLIYGASGYTGALVAREAARRGLRPVLAGRAPAVRTLADELGLEARVFGLEDPAAVRRGLDGQALVLHCAGPFFHTAAAMATACVEAGAHYLDITGEVIVFESLFARRRPAEQAGVMLLPGVGFDVVPTDCLAAHLKRRLPGATRLELALLALGRLSRGTLTTMVENLHRGGLVRRGGILTAVPPGHATRQVDFGRGTRTVVSIPWGDVSTAFHSTGIPDVTVYAAMSGGQRLGLALMRPLRPLLGAPSVQSFLKRHVQAGPPGPSAEERARGKSLVWGEVRDAAGDVARARLEGPEGYAFTVLTALAAVERALAGQVKPGFQTPSSAFGPDFVTQIAGVTRSDL